MHILKGKYPDYTFFFNERYVIFCFCKIAKYSFNIPFKKIKKIIKMYNNKLILFYFV